jgi:FKBP-type peptidyl-prolyl cis-trans isomerase
MKGKLILLVLISISMISACGQQSGGNNIVIKKNPPPPKTWDDSVSYYIGSLVGESLAADSININYNYYIKAIEDKRNGGEPLISEEAIRGIGMKFQQIMNANQAQKEQAEQERLQKDGKVNLEKSKKFLESNKNKPGVKTTASGMQYKVLKKGTGKKPVDDDLISFHLRAYDMDGNKFDDSYERGKPVQLPIQAGLLPGWFEALKMMEVGSKWKIWLPPELAFGERGLPGQIPPQYVTIFEIELLSIDGKQPPPADLNQQGTQPPPGGMH